MRTQYYAPAAADAYAVLRTAADDDVGEEVFLLLVVNALIQGHSDDDGLGSALMR